MIVSKLFSSLVFFYVTINTCLNFQHLETVIKSRIPGLQSLINKTIIELETELNRIGKPIAADTGVCQFLHLTPNSRLCV